MDLSHTFKDLSAKVDSGFDDAVEQLTRHVAVRSVSSQRPDGVRSGAEFVAAAAKEAGAADVTPGSCLSSPASTSCTESTNVP